MTRARLALTVLLPVLLSTACGKAAPAPQQPEAQPDRVHLCVSGELRGKLEPCGCASGQLGGLARRSYQIQLQNDYDLLLEGGNLVDGSTELDLLKWLTAVQVLCGGGRPYDAIGAGPNDLQLPFEDWCMMQQGLVPLVASDLECDLPIWPGKPFVEKVVRANIVRIASLTTAVPTALLEGKAPKLRQLPPAQGWARALVGAAPTTLRVLMLHAGAEVARQLARSLEPSPDLIVVVDSTYHEPPGQAEYVGTVPLVFPGVGGRMLLDLTLTRLPTGPRLGYAVVTLEGSKTKPGAMTDPDVRHAIMTHRQDVKERGVLEQLAETLPTPNGHDYVGNNVCRQCHEADYAVWAGSRHARAWQTLVDAEQDVKRFGWPVTAYPDCVGCHTVGYRQKSGFVDMQKTPQLSNVGCENCHGPGAWHAEDPAAHKLGKVGDGAPSLTCRKCHDFDQSPDFDYVKYWAKIAHGKKP